MLYAIVSDIHGNLPALEAVLADMPVTDQTLCLGDLVGYGPWPDECCAIARERFSVCIAGNHDRGAVTAGGDEWFNEAARLALLWTRDVLSSDSAAFLRNLPESVVVGETTLMHGSLVDRDEYITSAWEARPTLEMVPTPLALCGHTHVPEAYQMSEDTRLCARVASGSTPAANVATGKRTLMNCGSVGQPRDRDPRAAYAIFDSETGRVQVKRVAYDVEATQRAMLSQHLPHGLATRLMFGR